MILDFTSDLSINHVKFGTVIEINQNNVLVYLGSLLQISANYLIK